MQLIKELLDEKIELHKQWMKAAENMPEDTSCHAHANERVAHHAKLEVIKDTALPTDRRWLPMLNTIELKEQELRRGEAELIALHDLIIAAGGVPKPSLEVVADAGYSSVHDYLKLRAVDRVWNRAHPESQVRPAVILALGAVDREYPTSFLGSI